MQDNFGTPVSPGGSSAGAREAVSLPAILLMVTAALTFLYGVVGLVRPIDPDQMAQIQKMMEDPNMAPMRGFFEFLLSAGGRLILSLPSLIINGLVFFGALKMRSLQSYGLANTASILALIPCCGPCGCVGIPLGIWALVMLRKPEVRSAFS